MKNVLKAQGYETNTRCSSRLENESIIIEIKNSSINRNISQVQISPGGGRHGKLPYVKISTTDQGIIKVVDGIEDLYKTDGFEKAHIIFSGRK